MAGHITSCNGVHPKPETKTWKLSKCSYSIIFGVSVHTSVLVSILRVANWLLLCAHNPSTTPSFRIDRGLKKITEHCYTWPLSYSWLHGADGVISLHGSLMNSPEWLCRCMWVSEALWSLKARRHRRQRSSPQDSSVLWELSALEVPATFDHHSVSVSGFDLAARFPDRGEKTGVRLTVSRQSSAPHL